MPTPVSVARQCLAEEAAAALDDAVAVAKRRGHGQTTSLHAVSALLALPSSTLRDACSRARSNAYSPRLQFRALELCVGVALDRVSMSKSVSDEPPVSNSLMAAIKRAQANQRRHPETFHLYQQLISNSPGASTVSVVKVEMKHFIMSILDDPIVSRVFGDAGFRTHEVKMAVLNPLTTSRFSSVASRCPPLFLCSLSDLDSNNRSPKFPFLGVEKIDENSRRIGEILAKTNRRNPLLIGVCADDALKNFIEFLKKGEYGVFPKEIDGLNVISIEHEMTEFVNGALDQEMMGSKLKQAGEMVQNCQGPGVFVNCGNLKALMDPASLNAGNSVVSELKRLLVDYVGKVWLIGFLSEDVEYKKVLERFPSIETDWDLHLLPITSSGPSSIGGKNFKSSFMGSFVPFGGFFSNPSELETLSPITKSSSLCKLCNDKYEQEASSITKGECSDSVTNKSKVELPSWLQTAESGISKRLDTVEAKDDKTVLEARVTLLRRKWSDICRRFHCCSVSQEDTSPAKSQSSNATYFRDPPSREKTTDVMGSSLGNRASIPCIPLHLQNNTLQNQDTVHPVLSVGANKQFSVQNTEKNGIQNPSVSQQKMSPSIDRSSLLSTLSVATDLGLGTLYGSAKERETKFNWKAHPNNTQNLCETPRTHENAVSQVVSFSSCSEEQTYTKESDKHWKFLVENFSWQIEAVQAIMQTISRCRSGDGRYHGSDKRNIWFSFLGPDKVGKRKIAAAVAEAVFGRKDELLALDLSLQDHAGSFCPFDNCYSNDHVLKSGRKMIVDYLADELRKRPHSVVLLENIEKADTIFQYSLSRAIRTGKFLDSHGRDITIKNVVFVLSSSVQKVGGNIFSEAASEFLEERILEARKLQMQILVRSTDENYCGNNMLNVSIAPSKTISCEGPVKKRKLSNNEQFSRSIIDLNLPVEDMEEDLNVDTCSAEDTSENSEVWLKELLEHCDANVVFKPFDFDSLARKLLKEIDVRLKKVVGPKIFLEIDREVMVQILAAAWLTDRKNGIQDWIDQVLCPSLLEKVRQNRSVSLDFVIKLVQCHGLLVEEQDSGLCLPSRIYVN